jgi:uncharacterized protein (DUF1800 family)
MKDRSRRTFVKVAAAGGAAAGVGGFSAFSQWFFSWAQQQDGQPQPFQVPLATDIDEASHVLNRLTFGARPGDHARISAMGARAYINEQLYPDAIDDARSLSQSKHFEALDAHPPGELLEYAPAELLDQLTRDKIQRAIHSQRQLHEVMVDFWTDHFNIDPSKGDSRWFKPLDDRAVIRKHALGNFSTMLKASALSPAMLWYLDGRVNKRSKPNEKPNENYARELLELHILGVDVGYTQNDVMEVARCLTGWGLRERHKARFAVGKVEFHPEKHDNGAKKVLGVTIPAGLGAADLDRVIEIVAHHPATAHHLATKLCQRFIADDAPQQAVANVAKTFQAARGDIRETLRTVFAQDEFWRHRGNKIKRPFHYVVSALRATAAATDAGPALQDYLLRMGHAPFQYPTPDGYPSEPQPWMATLLWRWRFASEFAANQIKGTAQTTRLLVKAAGGEIPCAAHLLGRQATAAEILAAKESTAPLALILASPAFQIH